jgi:uncharacterized protein (DUF849 family)
MVDPVIISVAITGSVPRRWDNPALPVTMVEQVESMHAAYEAGASPRARARQQRKPDMRQAG